jgi:hypothetical protein
MKPNGKLRYINRTDPAVTWASRVYSMRPCLNMKTALSQIDSALCVGARGSIPDDSKFRFFLHNEVHDFVKQSSFIWFWSSFHDVTRIIGRKRIALLNVTKIIIYIWTLWHIRFTPGTLSKFTPLRALFTIITY